MKTFARDLVFYDMRRFELMYIYANRKELKDRVLRGELVETWRI